MSKITLKPGDYVRTEGMTEEQYNAVAKVFMAAGARDDGDVYFEKYKDDLSFIGWDKRDGEVWDCGIISSGFSRELTIDQILGTEQEEAPMTIEQLLAKASNHATKAARHERKRQALIEQARELLPKGWKLEESGLVAQPAEDMTDPANWKAGDVVECIESAKDFTKGRQYSLTPWSSSGVAVNARGDASAIDNAGYDHYAPAKHFKWISRPQ